MSGTINSIFTSSVVAVLCSGIFSLINNRKNNIIGYVIEERREWRKEIKNIADELTIANGIYEIRRVLNKLKLRINSFGMGKKEDYLHDSHIWELIKVMEEKPYENLIENKEKMLIYISLLLQYDCEKTQKVVEERRKLYIIASLVLMGLGSIYMIYIHFFERGLEYNENFVGAWMVLVFLPFALALVHPIKGISNIFRRKDNIGYKVFICISSPLILIFSVLGYSSLIRNIISYYNITWEYLDSAKGYLETLIVLLLMAVLFIVVKIGDIDNVEKEYVDRVKQIYNEDKSSTESNAEKQSKVKSWFNKIKNKKKGYPKVT